MIPSGLVMVQNIPITKVITTCLFSFIFCGELKSSSSAFVNAKRHGGGSIVIDDRNHNIFWFMQITDLHLSKFGHKDRGEDLREFCSTHIPVIQPELVIASGDITDGKSSIIPGSSQHIEEWENYKSVLVNSGVLKLTKWFDIRGNHDAFDVPSSGHARDYYSQFGVKGKPPTKSYIFKVSKSYGQYSFVSIDLSLEPGIKWPFNFFGYLSMDVQKQLLKSITQAKGSNQTFIFGHHPTSTVVSQDLNLRSLIGDNAFAYLCGHLHTLHGTTKRMYVSQPQGYWEWELGDWRENRYYRIVAVDHDLVSFVDVVKSTKNSGVTEWPIILITNPKNSQFLLPNKEPVDRIKSSTHIRILVWSKWPIQSVSVKINDIFQGYAQPATLVDDDTITPTTQSPLYILSWNPSQWSDASHSFHTIEVTAKDTFGNQRTVTQPFSFQDPTEFKTGFLSRYFISTNLSTSVAVLYYMLWILMCTFVILPRFFHRPRFIGCLYRTRLGKGMYRLSSTNRILFVVLIYMLYSISCPIFMGYLWTTNSVTFSVMVFILMAYIFRNNSHMSWQQLNCSCFSSSCYHFLYIVVNDNLIQLLLWIKN
ncbi:unnamed protein product [Heterobilharzia americana]|nr:unnamed protein product [Heterobilharzia americana]